MVRAAGGDRQDPRADYSDHRRMASKHAEIALHAGDVDLIDLAGEGELFGETRSKWKVAMLNLANSE